jgi:hypothetical protein
MHYIPEVKQVVEVSQAVAPPPPLSPACQRLVSAMWGLAGSCHPTILHKEQL